MTEITWDDLSKPQQSMMIDALRVWNNPRRHVTASFFPSNYELNDVQGTCGTADALVRRGLLDEVAGGYKITALGIAITPGRNLREAARIIHNENGTPVALNDGWQHVGDYPPALSPIEQALHWARNNGGIMPAPVLKAAVLDLCAERDALLAENARLRGAAQQAMDWIDRVGANSPIVLGGEAKIYHALRDALKADDNA